MRCSNGSQENPYGTKFCDECGQELTVIAFRDPFQSRPKRGVRKGVICTESDTCPRLQNGHFKVAPLGRSLTQKEGSKMKKRAVLIMFAVVLGFGSILNAADYSWLKGGATAYLSSYSSGGLFFFAKKGTPIAVFTRGNSSTLKGFGGVKGLSAPSGSPFLDTGFTGSTLAPTLTFTAPLDDVYLVVFIKSSGVSADLFMAAVDITGLQGIKTERELDEDVPPELLEKLQDAFSGYLKFSQ